jgi:lysophospholipase L1-like esterase
MTRRGKRPGGSPPARPLPTTVVAAARPAWLLWLVVLAIPVALLALAEGALRLAGFGHDLEPLFLASPAQAGYRQPNPLAVRRFFSDPAAAPAVSIETTYFRNVKPVNGLRIVVQGESSAAGFPYGLSASLAGMLQERLQRSFPSREVEVISTAMAAVTSYALVDFADEIIAARPDAVVIYVGHNEYLGILGVGSTMRMASSRGLTRGVLALRELRLYQLMQRAVSAIRPAAHAAAADPAESLMARVAGERQIESSSRLYGLGLAQFRANLTTLLARYRRAGIPVFIGTLISNEADQPPLGAGALNAAARAAYQRGTALVTDGRYAEARAAFIAARDLDVLRFRAPSEFNGVLRSVAAAEGATVVDVERAFVAASEHGIIGHGLVLEHVHPNLDGYFLLAEAFFQSLLAHGVPGPAEVTVPTAEARADAPVSEIDRWLGDYKTLRLRSNWPFRATPAAPAIPPPADLAQALAQEVYYQRLGWVEAHERLRARYREAHDVRNYAKLSGILADAFPFTAALQFDTAVALIGVGRPVDALRYALRGTAVDAGSVNGLLIEAHALTLNGRLADARRVLERVLVLAPGNVTATGVIAEIDARLAKRGSDADPAVDGPVADHR